MLKMENNEEFNNFMHRVTEISNLVHGLTSEDREVADRSKALADKYIENEKTTIYDIDENIEMKIKCDRTVINKKACHKVEKPSNTDNMDPETFMTEVSKDAAQRSKDRKVRREKADTLKTQASKAFRRGEYDRALSCYNRAIEFVRDSALLYTNRALTLIKLKKFDKVLPDCEWALRLNENSFKARLYTAKSNQALENIQEFEVNQKELLEMFPEHKDIITEFLKENSASEENDSN